MGAFAEGMKYRLRQLDEKATGSRFGRVLSVCGRRAKPIFVRGCEWLAANSLFSAVTTLLTIYALFGDDIRLRSFTSEEDPYFDYITVAGMSIFTLEIVVRTLGQAGYKYGFFFWLDILSTVTLILDVTYISERTFGDSISTMLANDDLGDGGNKGQTGDEAQRAAKMSRVGTKAGRIVRLIRLIRLIRLLKMKRGNYQEAKKEEAPGLEWEEEDDDGMENESAVSKKLSEMTTRRVVMLVLVIMLAMPFFTPTMYLTNLPTAAQYGIDGLYRTWRDGLEAHTPLASSTDWAEYLNSVEREVYIDDFYHYAFFHNPACSEESPPETVVRTPASSFGKIFWMGVSSQADGGAGSSDHGVLAELFLPRFHNLTAYDPNLRWNGDGQPFYRCDLTDNPRSIFDIPWESRRSCVKGRFGGVSVLEAMGTGLTCPEDLRYQERVVIFPSRLTVEEWGSAYFVFVFDRRSGSQTEAALNIAQTLFICLLLGLGALTFSSDANKYVLNPIERMIANVEKIRNNPLAAMSLGDQEIQRQESRTHRKTATGRMTLESGLNLAEMQALRESYKDKSRLKRLWESVEHWWSEFRGKDKPPQKEQPEPMETVVLEKTIIKIGALLALGFGEAGAKIIAQNMRGGESSIFNAIVPGRHVRVIFGVANIRNFTDATESLQDQVMVFMNRIAGIVHRTVNDYFGSPNQSIGDSFLLTWTLSDVKPEKEQKLSDMSLLCMCKLTVAINKSPLLVEYRTHPLLGRRLPNYRVRLGYSLHCGSAIEGAIGSEFKIDASYLSSSITVAARLETASKHYAVSVTLTEKLQRLLSHAVASETREIDYVTIEGASEPLRIYAYDLDDMALVSANSVMKNHGVRTRVEVRRKKAERWADDYDIAQSLARDPDIETMRQRYTDEFFALFRHAYINFQSGEWEVARDVFNKTKAMLGLEDGPTVAHLKLIEKHSGEAPDDWKGYQPIPQPQ